MAGTAHLRLNRGLPATHLGVVQGVPAVACKVPSRSTTWRRHTLARAKNTARAEARRRARAEARAEARAAAATAEQDETEAATEAPTQPRKPLFTPPNVRADLRALPGLFRERKLLWLPVGLLVVGFVLTYLTYLGQIPPELAGPVEIYIQFFFVPYGLFTFFIAGFIAPRAAYLVGLLMGVFNGLLWTVLIYVGTTLPALPQDPAEPIAPVEPFTASTQVILVASLYGLLAAAFAAWYRNFLRQMQERGRQRRADREAQEKARRRDERRAARRST